MNMNPGDMLYFDHNWFGYEEDEGGVDYYRREAIHGDPNSKVDNGAWFESFSLAVKLSGGSSGLSNSTKFGLFSNTDTDAGAYVSNTTSVGMTKTILGSNSADYTYGLSIDFKQSKFKEGGVSATYGATTTLKGGLGVLGASVDLRTGSFSINIGPQKQGLFIVDFNASTTITKATEAIELEGPGGAD